MADRLTTLQQQFARTVAELMLSGLEDTSIYYDGNFRLEVEKLVGRSINIRLHGEEPPF